MPNPFKAVGLFIHRVNHWRTLWVASIPPLGYFAVQAGQGFAKTTDFGITSAAALMGVGMLSWLLSSTRAFVENDLKEMDNVKRTFEMVGAWCTVVGAGLTFGLLDKTAVFGMAWVNSPMAFILALAAFVWMFSVNIQWRMRKRETAMSTYAAGSNVEQLRRSA